VTTTRHKKAKKTAFVPRLLFASAVGAGVIPFCVTACGGLESSPQSSGSSFGGVSSGTVASGAFTVASGAFSVGVSAFGDSGTTFSVATAGFDAGVEFTVAAIGFDVAEAGFASPPEPNLEAGGAQDVTIDSPGLTVAFMGFDASAPEHDAADKG
jgi:hypothetical protein